MPLRDLTQILRDVTLSPHAPKPDCKCTKCRNFHLTRRVVETGLNSGLYPAIPVRSDDTKVVDFFRALLETSEVSGGRAPARGSSEKNGPLGGRRPKNEDAPVGGAKHSFHPQFAQPPAGQRSIIVSSDEDILFYASAELLESCSELYVEMTSMRHLGAADDNTGPLPMGASTLGVRALLSIIDDDPKKVDWIGPFIRASRYHPDVALLFEDLCRLADMWRISKPVKTNKAAEPERRIAFSKLMASRLGSSTFDLLTLSMMMQDQAAADGHARAIVLADLDPLTMPETARILLERFAPLYLIRIHTQFRLRERWWAGVELRFKIEESMGSNEFGLGCKKRGCASYKAYQAKARKCAVWQMLRSAVAEAALQAMKMAGSEEAMDLSLVTAIRSVVECGVCRERFRKAFRAAIGKEHQKGWTWDLSDGGRTPYIDWIKDFSRQED